MRLINAETRLFEMFNDETKLPAYAILSHRWVDGQEIVYKDFRKERNLHLNGRQKIDRCCLQALEDGILYVWVDTCCIDKKSSAELSEAINSMYRWYGMAKVCYAYLNDVDHGANREQSFVKSAWFTRSWTLQEMLAPKSLKFYDARWRYIGEKSSLSEDLAEASGIHLSVFTSDQLNLNDWSVAQRMSWASNRKATRVEDVAYSLLGLFGVNMPLLYGEGNRAFRRLQEEIIRDRCDHTIFAWSADSENSHLLLARSPAAFSKDANVTQHNFYDTKAYAITNVGLSVELSLELWLPRIYWAGLNATENGLDQIGIWLLTDGIRRDLYQKVDIPWSLLEEDDQLRPGSIMTTSRSLNQRRCGSRQINILVEGGRPVAIPRLGSLVLRSIQMKADMTFASFEFTKFRGLGFKGGRYIQDVTNIDYNPENSESPVIRRWHGTHGYFPSFGIVYASHSRPCTGIVFDVLFGTGTRSLGVFSVGFDAEMCPVFLLAERSHVEQAKSTRPPRNAKSRSPEGPRNESLRSKNIWQCDGLEAEGWQGPAKRPYDPLESISKGLWAFKATEQPYSSFYIDLGGDPDRFVEILIEKQRIDRLMYSISFDERRYRDIPAGLYQDLPSRYQARMKTR